MVGGYEGRISGSAATRFRKFSPLGEKYKDARREARVLCDCASIRSAISTVYRVISGVVIEKTNATYWQIME